MYVVASANTLVARRIITGTTLSSPLYIGTATLRSPAGHFSDERDAAALLADVPLRR